jgi:filamentous hemagglutinin family protein
MKHRRFHQAAPRRSALVLALALAGLASHLGAGAQGALPGGLNVVQGQASAQVQGNRLTVTNSAGAVLNWQSFSIGTGSGVHFQQPDAASRVLNRVVGRDPSQILGSLTSNGEVWLLNPYGVAFGRDARVDVRSLVVSTLNIGNDDWQRGRLRLAAAAGDPGAAVVNQGELRGTGGGRILLVGGEGGVRNEGLIVAPGGQVALAAGRSVELADSGQRDIAVRVDAPAGQAINLGQIGGSRVDLAAAMVNQSGIVRAEALDGAGGQVVLSAAGRSTVDGRIDARGEQGRGGDVQVLGREVGLLEGSSIDVSGRDGGGSVHAGGGRQGADPRLRNAEALYMDPGANVAADALQAGDGGSIVLWSDGATRAYGSLSARGGPRSGDGGFIETSGGWLDARPLALRTDAPAGRAGLWLLDPNDLLITSSGLDTNISGGPNFSTLNDNAVLSTATIVAALNLGNNVTIATANGGASTQPGDVRFSGAFINAAPPAPVSFTVNASRNISMLFSSISTSAQPINITLNAGTGGAIAVDESSLLSGGGNISLGGPNRATGTGGQQAARAGALGNAASGGFGVSIVGSVIDAGSGNVTMVGQSTAASAGLNAVGVRIVEDVEADTRIAGANIDIWGWSSSDTDIARAGVSVAGRFTTITAAESLAVTGLASSRVFAGGTNAQAPVGVSIDDASIVAGSRASANGPNLLIDGTVSDGAPGAGPNVERVGVRLSGTGLGLQAGGGSGVRIVGRDAINSPGNSAAVTISGGGTVPYNFTQAGPLVVDGDTSVRIGGIQWLLPTAQSARISAGGNLLVFTSLSGDAAVLDIAGGDITYFGSIGLGLTRPGSVNFTSTGNTSIRGATLRGSNAPVDFTFTAAAGGSGAGTITLSQTSVSSSGGNVALGGGSRVQGPNLLAPRSGAVDADGQAGAGVSILGSSIDAGSGRVSVNGHSVAGQGGAVGVLIDRYFDGEVSTFSRLAGADIDIFGWVDSNAPIDRAGVTLTGGSTIDATRTLQIQGTANSSVYQSLGRSGPVGVLLGGAVSVQPQQADPQANLQIIGQTNDGPQGQASRGGQRAGVLVQGAGSTMVAGGDAFVNIQGSDLSPNGEVAVQLSGPLLEFTGAGSVTIGASPSSLELLSLLNLPTAQPVQLTGDLVTLRSPSVAGSPSELRLEARSSLVAESDVNLGAGSVILAAPVVSLGAQGRLSVNTPGTISLFTDQLQVGPAAFLNSAAAGDAIVMAGFDRASNIGQVPADFGGLGLRTTNGRWLAYLANDSVLFDAETVNQNFYRYETVYPALPQAGDFGNGILFAQPLQLTLEKSLPVSKVYDGTTTAPTLPDSAFAITGLRSWQVQDTPLSGVTLSFFSPNAAAVASLVPVLAVPGFSDQQGIPVYGYQLSSSMTGTITPRTLTLSGVTAADKVYDGTRSATLAGGTLANLVAGQTLGLAYSGALFDAAGVGSLRTVSGTASLVDGSGLAANYQLAPGASAQASITPATLSYVATPASLTRGQSFPAFGGTVSGFVAEESLASATTGTLAFATTASPQSPAGRYAINGSGLAAQNYVFTQAPGNATALTLAEATAPPPPSTPSVDLSGPEEVARVLRAKRDDVIVRVADELPQPQRTLDPHPGLRPDAGGVGQRFGTVNVDALSWPSLTALLAARGQYKQSLLRDAVERLAAEPGLADLPACETVQQAESGECLVTDDLIAKADDAPAAAPGVTPAPRPAPGPAAAPLAAAPALPSVPAAAALPAVPAAPALAAAPATPVTPAPAAPPAAVAVAPPTPPTAGPGAAPARMRPTVHPLLQAPPLPANRPAVVSATLPQIQRKLAVLVGIDNYADGSIPSLENAGRDVDAVARLLSTRLGYETVVVRDAGRRALVGVLNKLALTARPNDSVIVYYAGHGTVVETTGRGYWIPADADAARPQSWVANTDIERLMGSIRASQVVLIADSCFSGSLVDLRRGSLSAPAGDVQQLLSRRAAVVMSSGGNEPVADGGRSGHSPFAASLMSQLGGLEAWRPGVNVFQRVRDDVTRRIPQTPQYGPARQGRHAQGADYLFEQRQIQAR